MEKLSKRDANRQERRGAIIAVARAHFFEHGYAATSMSAIAAALGGSKGTLWSYFSSKEELFAAVIDDAASGVRARLDLADASGGPFEQLVRLCRSFIDRGSSPVVQSMMRLIISEGHRQPDVPRIFYETGPKRTQLLIADYLEEEFAGLLHTDDYFDAGNTLVALCMGDRFFLQLWGVIGQPSVEEREAAARKAAILFLKAYARDFGSLGLDGEVVAATGTVANVDVP